MSPEAANFNWLLDNFVKSVPGVRHTIVVSADGLLMAMSDQLDRTSGDQLAAIVAGLSSLTRGRPDSCAAATSGSRSWRWTPSSCS
jgi:predicted regulator of Ras-like GTPase activity (Roadblock/LC7/MglB family)